MDLDTLMGFMGSYQLRLDILLTIWCFKLLKTALRFQVKGICLWLIYLHFYECRWIFQAKSSGLSISSKSFVFYHWGVFEKIANFCPIP